MRVKIENVTVSVKLRRNVDLSSIIGEAVDSENSNANMVIIHPIDSISVQIY